MCKQSTALDLIWDELQQLVEQHEALLVELGASTLVSRVRNSLTQQHMLVFKMDCRSHGELQSHAGVVAFDDAGARCRSGLTVATAKGADGSPCSTAEHHGVLLPADLAGPSPLEGLHGYDILAARLMHMRRIGRMLLAWRLT